MTAASAHHATPLPPTRAFLTNRQRIKMLFKRLYFPPRLSAGGSGCAFIQPKMGISRVDRLSSATPSQKMLQPNPIALNTPPDEAASWHIHTATISPHTPPKIPGEGPGKAGREQPPSRAASPGSGAGEQGSAMSAGTALLPPGERLPVACRWLLLIPDCLSAFPSGWQRARGQLCSEGHPTEQPRQG